MKRTVGKYTDCEEIDSFVKSLNNKKCNYKLDMSGYNLIALFNAIIKVDTEYGWDRSETYLDFYINEYDEYPIARLCTDLIKEVELEKQDWDPKNYFRLKIKYYKNFDIYLVGTIVVDSVEMFVDPSSLYL